MKSEIAKAGCVAKCKLRLKCLWEPMWFHAIFSFSTARTSAHLI